MECDLIRFNILIHIIKVYIEKKNRERNSADMMSQSERSPQMMSDI